jgi:hypothetical protein
MIAQKQTSKEYFRSIYIIYFAILLGQVMMAVVFVFLQMTGEFEGDKSFRNMFLLIVPLVVIGTLIGSHVLFKNRLRIAVSQKSLSEIMTVYRSALIIRYVLLEASLPFALVAYLLTGDPLFLAIAGIVIVYFLLEKPGVKKAITDLGSCSVNINIISDPEQVIAEYEDIS